MNLREAPRPNWSNVRREGYSYSLHPINGTKGDVPTGQFHSTDLTKVSSLIYTAWNNIISGSRGGGRVDYEKDIYTWVLKGCSRNWGGMPPEDHCGKLFCGWGEMNPLEGNANLGEEPTARWDPRAPTESKTRRISRRRLSSTRKKIYPCQPGKKKIQPPEGHLLF